MHIKLNIATISLICFVSISCANLKEHHVTNDTQLKSVSTQGSKGNISPKDQARFSDMVLIPAGEFTMGMNDVTADHNHGSSNHEHHDHSKHKDVDFGKHEHNVFLDSYYIDKYEVTNGMYNKFMQAGGYSKAKFWTKEGWQWRVENNITEPNWWLEDKTSNYKGSPDYPDHPVTGLSWYEAMAYATWADKSLPTEAQWEKAARGVETGNIYPWGNDEPDCQLANFCVGRHDFCVNSTSTVGAFEKGKSPYGVYDMSGNVWEWCKDWYSVDFYKISPSENPECTEAGAKKLLRGGSWVNVKEFINSTFRQKAKPGLRNYFNGFRCVVGMKSN
ncbi:MAG: formylglycine-generating enzyme family protein [Candidatus Anammoxibacter sp.]